MPVEKVKDGGQECPPHTGFASARRNRGHSLQPSSKFPQRQPTLLPVPLLPVADFVFKRRKQIERNIRRLEVLGIGVGDVVHQRAEGGGPWRDQRLRS